MKYRSNLYQFTICSIWGLMLLIWLVLTATGAISPYVSCFAVDSRDRLYVGKHNRIDVYEDGILVDSIITKTSQGYLFTIAYGESGDYLCLASSTHVNYMDLSGKKLDSFEDPGGDVYRQMKRTRREFLSRQSDTYRLHDILGWHYIEKNDAEIVYRISLFSFLAKYALYLAFVFLGGYCVWLQYTRKKR